MPYTPNPADVTQPVGSVDASTAAPEFRALKSMVPFSVSVKDPIYGATGDGVTDDTAAIVAAIATGALKIYLPEGDYVVKLNGLKLGKGGGVAGSPSQQLVGAGVDVTTILYKPGAPYSTDKIAVWFGNSVDNTILPANQYDCLYPVFEGISIRCDQYAYAALRTREVIHGKFNGFIGGIPGETAPGNPAPTTFYGIIADGTLDCDYNFDIDIGSGHEVAWTVKNVFCGFFGPGCKLDISTGSAGSGSVFSTSRVKGYFHHATWPYQITADLTSTFSEVILESCARGFAIGPASPNFMLNTHIEGINFAPIEIDGSSAAAQAHLVMLGGTFSTANQGVGAIIDRDTLLHGIHAGKIVVRDLRVAQAAYPQSYQLTTDGNAEMICIDAYNFQSPVNPNVAVLANPGDITVTNGSAEILVKHIAHGKPVGTIFGLQKFTTPINTLRINQPYYRITAVPDADHFKGVAVISPLLVGSATSTVAGTGVERIIFYDPTAWGNFMVTQPARTIFNDCKNDELTFSQTFAGATGAENLLINGQRAYMVDNWSYVMDARNFVNTNDTGMASSVIIDMPDGYETSFKLADIGTVYNALAYAANTMRYTGVTEIGVKIPPKSLIRINATPNAAQVITTRLRIAQSGIY